MMNCCMGNRQTCMIGKSKDNRRSEAQLYLPLPASCWQVSELPAPRSFHGLLVGFLVACSVCGPTTDRLRPGGTPTDCGVQTDTINAASEVYMQWNLPPTILVVPQLKITTIWLHTVTQYQCYIYTGSCNGENTTATYNYTISTVQDCHMLMSL